MADDLPFLRRVIVVHYEDLIAQPESELSRLLDFVGVEPRRSELEVRSHINESYFASWERAHGRPFGELHRRLIARRFGARVARFGYSLTELRRPPQPFADTGAGDGAGAQVRAARTGAEDAAEPGSVISDGRSASSPYSRP